ncbi:MAG TPA: ABC transporter permease [Terriglobia bacterium]|nr:ABC transporter permease [Terriglobia bacterium]
MGNPAIPTISESFDEVLQYRDLLYMLTWRDIKARYKQSMMGFFWAILMPLLIVGAGILVRFAFSMSSGHHINVTDISGIALKSLPWAFFVGAIKFGTNSMVSNPNLVTKIYFPREVFPLAAVLASLFDAVIASSVVIVLLIVSGVGASVQLLWVPLILVLIVLFTAALAMFLSCANLFFRDVKYLVDVTMTFGIFFTPVFYDASMLHKWAPLVLLNPLGALLEALNSAVILHQAPSLPWLGYAAAWAILGLLAAWRIFDRAEASFAETI